MTNAYIEGTGSKLAEALVAFQAEPPKVEKDSYNPAFKSNFTSLEELTNKALPALNAHGLAYTVTSEITERGMAVVGTLLHTSGESLSASFPVADTNPQKIGSAFTYARRYLLAALTGIVVDADDDGNAASQPSQAQQKVQAAAQNIPAKKTPTAPAQGADKDRLDVLNGVLRAYVGNPKDDSKSKAVNGALAEISNTEKNPVKQREAVIRKVLEQDVSGRSNEEIKKKFGLD